MLVKSSVKAAQGVLDKADFVFLDVNVTNGETFKLGEILMEKGVPFVFISATRPADLPPRLKDAPFIEKPALGEKSIERAANLAAE